ERGFFKSFETYGFDYRTWNEAGACTLHYSVEDIKKIKNLKDIIPNWCFRFIDWALAKNDGKCSFKIDWFAAKGLELAKEASALSPRVIRDLDYQEREC